MLKVVVGFDEYKPWSGAVSTYEEIEKADKLEELEEYLDEIFDGEATNTQINDALWFDGEQILSNLGIIGYPDEVEYSAYELDLDFSDPELTEKEIRDIIDEALHNEFDEFPNRFTWKMADDGVVVYNIVWNH